MSASTWTRLQFSEALVWEENCRSAVVPTCLVFKMAFNEADDTVFCSTCRKMFKEKKNKTSTKADPAFVSSSLYFLASTLSNLLWFTSFEILVIKYMVFGFQRLL